jgi:hypothetical protein
MIHPAPPFIALAGRKLKKISQIERTNSLALLSAEPAFRSAHTLAFRIK